MRRYIRILFLVLIVCCFNACNLLQPIVHVTAYCPARPYAILVTEIPAGTKYLGTVKIVPGDNAFRTSFKKEKIMNKLLDEAAKVGADYVYVKSIEKTNKDFFFDLVYSDGYTIMGEMYRLQD
jgi:hypothetical protein